MANPTDVPRLDDLFAKLFPCPEGVSLPVVRFGNAMPPRAQRLPQAGSTMETEKRDPFRLSWQDEALGIEVLVVEEEGPQGIEIWASAVGILPELRGKAVSVALQAEKENRFRHVIVPLDKPEGETNCSGKVCFGSAVELREKLGDAVTIDVFLLDEPT